MAYKHLKRGLKDSVAYVDKEKGTIPEEMVAPSALRAAWRNARTHSKKQICQIAESIERFGFVSPVIVDHRNRIVCVTANDSIAMVYNDRTDKAKPFNRFRNLADLFLGMSPRISPRGPKGAGRHHFFGNGPFLLVDVGDGVLESAFQVLVGHSALSRCTASR